MPIAFRQQTVGQRLTASGRSTLGFVAMVVIAAVLAAGCASEGAGPVSSSEPWASDTVMPADLVTELKTRTGADKPVVVCTAPPVLYRVGHIPGAVLHGPGFSPAGIKSLTAWAQPLPRSTSIVIYCGCCPLPSCPNLTPAYTALKGLGFTRVRVLLLADSFRADWVERGYPVER